MMQSVPPPPGLRRDEVAAARRGAESGLNESRLPPVSATGHMVQRCSGNRRVFPVALDDGVRFKMRHSG